MHDEEEKNLAGEQEVAQVVGGAGSSDSDSNNNESAKSVALAKIDLITVEKKAETTDEVSQVSNVEEVQDSDKSVKDKEFLVSYEKVEDVQSNKTTPDINQQQGETYTSNGNAPELFSKVSSSPGSKRLMIIFLVVAVITLVYYMVNMIKEEDRKKDPNKKQQQELLDKKEEVMKASKPISSPTPLTETKFNVPASVQKLPDLPAIVLPQAPEPPPTPTPIAPSTVVFPSISQTSNSTGSSAQLPPSISGEAQMPQFSQGNKLENKLSSLLNKDEEEEKKKLLERRKSSSLLYGGGGGISSLTHSASTNSDKKGDTDKDEKTGKDKSSEFLGFGEGSFDQTSLQQTSSPHVNATKVGDLSSMILQGKILNAVLESAINTDLPGSLRAIITRDVYAENGKAVLIPKGSRIIGTYQSTTTSGQNRIGIIWSRLIRPDGIDIQLGDAQGTDQLGRAGIDGYLDSKFWTKMGLAVLTSYIIPMAALRIANVKDNQTSTTTSVNAGTTSTQTLGTASATQLQASSQQFQQIATDAINNAFNTKPTIIIDQGTRINIYVNKDLLFPKDVALNSLKIIK